MAGVEDVGALRGRADLGLVGALPGGPQLGPVLQGQAGVTVVQDHHGSPAERKRGIRNQIADGASARTSSWSEREHELALLELYHRPEFC